MSVLKIEHLSYKIQQFQILKELSFRIEDGDYLGIIGPNGAGKSTLLKLLFNFFKPTNGVVFLDEQNIQLWSIKKIAQHIAYLPQIIDWEILKGLTVDELLNIGNFNISNIKKKEILHLLNITKYLDRYIETLSGGEKQKVLLANTLLQNTKIILLDEAFAFLDIKHQLELEQIIQWLRDEKKIVVSIFHSVNLLKKNQKILGLKQGEQVFLGTAEDYITKQVSSKIFDISFQWIETNQYFVGYPAL